MSKIALNATDIVITIPLLEEIPDTQTVDKVMEDIKERVQRIYMGIALNKQQPPKNAAFGRLFLTTILTTYEAV